VRALSPLETLRRGYAVVQDDHGHVVTSVAEVAEEQPVSIRVVDGRVLATTTGIEREEEA
jgi:exodeoxyribonuclease VII large subunit